MTAAVGASPVPAGVPETPFGFSVVTERKGGGKHHAIYFDKLTYTVAAKKGEATRAPDRSSRTPPQQTAELLRKLGAVE